VTNASDNLSFRRELPLVLGVTIILLLISIWLQVQVSRSMMTQSAEIWEDRLELHVNEYPFKLRPFQTYATKWLHEATGVDIKTAFYLIQFTLAFLLAMAFYVLLRRLRFDQWWSLVGLVMLLTAYPILGAHYAPTYTWDDFWGYLFVTLGLLATIRERPWLVAIWLLLASIARETNVIFVPLAFLPLWRKADNRATLMTAAAIPIVATLAIRFLWGTGEDFSRWAWHINYNFENGLRVNDTVVSFIIAFGPLWLLSLLGFYEVRTMADHPSRQLLLWGYAVATPIFVILALTGGLARETRLFFPPFVFLIPLSVIALRSLVRRIRTDWTRKPKYLPVEALVALCIVGVIASNWLFPEFDFGMNANIRRPLAGVHLGMIFWVAWIYLVLRYIGAKHQPGDSLTA